MAPFLALCAVACVACDGDAGDDDAAGPDGSVDGGVVAAPAPAELPVFGPCLEGWRAFDAEGIEACDPWPETGRAACPVGLAHFPGTPGCATVGPTCPADGFPTDLPAGPVLYVEAGAASGTGSRADPYGTITEALDVAAGGDVVAVAVGEYLERITLPLDVTVVGACASGVQISGADAGGAATAIRRVTLGGGAGSGLRAGAGTGVTVEDLVIHRASSGGLVARGGAITGQRVVVTDTVATMPANGCGVGVYDGGEVTLDALVIGRARADAIYVSGAGSTAILGGASIFDVRPDEDGDAGRGVFTRGAGSTVLRGVVIEGARAVAILGTGRATISLTDVVVRDTGPRMSDSTFGRALSALGGTTVSATRFFAENNHDVGVFSEDDGSRVRLSHVLVRDMRSEAVDGSGGRCVVVQDEGAMSIDHGLFSRCRDIGVLVHGAGAVVESSDITVRDTLDQEVEPAGGWGGGAQYGGSLILNRALIEGCSEIGLYAHGMDSVLKGDDIAIRDTASDTSEGIRGRGVSIQEGALGTFDRLLVEASREGGVMAMGAGTRIVANDLTVRDTSSAACVADGCDSNAASLSSYDGAEFEAARFHLEGAEICGLWLDQGAGLDLRQGVIRGNPIGACIIDEAFDIGRISDDVRYEENGTNLDAPALPVPSPVEPLPT